MPAAIDAVTQMPTGGDPVLESVKWFAMMLGGVIAAASPVMYYVRKYNSDRAADARDGAEKALYASLGQQVTSLKQQLDEVFKAHNELLLKHGQVLTRLAKVEGYEQTIENLKSALSFKETALSEKDAELRAEREHNRLLVMEVMELKGRLSSLEKRILEGETEYLREQLLMARSSQELGGFSGLTHTHGDGLQIDTHVAVQLTQGDVA